MGSLFSESLKPQPLGNRHWAQGWAHQCLDNNLHLHLNSCSQSHIYKWGWEKGQAQCPPASPLISGSGHPGAPASWLPAGKDPHPLHLRWPLRGKEQLSQGLCASVQHKPGWTPSSHEACRMIATKAPTSPTNTPRVAGGPLPLRAVRAANHSHQEGRRTLFLPLREA